MTRRIEERHRNGGRIAGQSAKAGIAITEGQLSLNPHNANPILYERPSAAYHAKSLNIHN
jgi:hypothetical protein